MSDACAGHLLRLILKKFRKLAVLRPAGVLLEAVGHNFAREERVSAAPHI